jgi:hypothetical protein
LFFTDTEYRQTARTLSVTKEKYRRAELCAPILPVLDRPSTRDSNMGANNSVAIFARPRVYAFGSAGTPSEIGPLPNKLAARLAA